MKYIVVSTSTPVVMHSGRIPIRQLAMFAITSAIVSAGNTPVRIEQTVEAQFPPRLNFSTISSGEARVMINIDADGQLADLLVTGYTHQAFADEAVRVLKQWRYHPAIVNDEAVGSRVELQINFIATGRVVSLTALDATSAFVQRMWPATLFKRVCTQDELDRPIEVLQTVTPFHPGQAEHASDQAGVLLDFYVDEDGRTRMPVVMETTSLIYAQAAVGALSQWRFAVPTSRGKPVAVRVRQKFVFSKDS
jgi:TonB family protein